MHKWIFTFGAVGGVIGMTIGQLLKGNLDFASILGSFTALLLMVGVDVARMRLKKDKTPDFDERTVHNMQKFYAYAANIFIGTLLIGLAVVSLMGIEKNHDILFNNCCYDLSIFQRHWCTRCKS